MTKAASIIAYVHRPLISSHAKPAAAAMPRPRSVHRPALAITRGSARRAQLPSCSADTSVDTPKAEKAIIIQGSIGSRQASRRVETMISAFTDLCQSGLMLQRYCYLTIILQWSEYLNIICHVIRTPESCG
jgi:hypothetical protein